MYWAIERDILPHSRSGIMLSPGRAAGRITCGSQVFPENLSWVRAANQTVVRPAARLPRQKCHQVKEHLNQSVTEKVNRVCIAGERSSSWRCFAAVQPSHACLQDEGVGGVQSGVYVFI